MLSEVVMPLSHRLGCQVLESLSNADPATSQLILLGDEDPKPLRRPNEYRSLVRSSGLLYNK